MSSRNMRLELFFTLFIFLFIVACADTDDEVVCQNGRERFALIKSSSKNTHKMLVYVGRDTLRFDLKKDTVLAISSPILSIEVVPELGSKDSISLGQTIRRTRIISFEGCNVSDTIRFGLEDVTLPGSGKLWAYESASKKIYSFKIDSLGEKADSLSFHGFGMLSSNMNAMAFDAYGELWMSLGDHIEQLNGETLGGSAIRRNFSMVDNNFSKINAIAFSPSGRLWLADSAQNLVWGYSSKDIVDRGDTAHTFKISYTILPMGPKSILVDSTEALWVLESSIDQVSVWSPSLLRKILSFDFKYQDSILVRLEKIYVWKNYLWIAFDGGKKLAWVGFAKLNQSTVNVDGVLNSDSLGYGMVSSMSTDRSDHLWLSGVNGSFARLTLGADSSQMNVQIIKKNTGLAHTVLSYPSARSSWTWDLGRF